MEAPSIHARPHPPIFLLLLLLITFLLLLLIFLLLLPWSQRLPLDFVHLPLWTFRPPRGFIPTCVKYTPTSTQPRTNQSLSDILAREN